MYKYAQLNDSNNVEAISDLSGQLTRSNMILLADDHDVELGDLYINGQFVKPAEPESERLTLLISNENITVNNETVIPFAGNYYCNIGDTINLVCTLVDTTGNTADITIPVILKMPLVRHANGQPTQDEIYFNVTVQSGVMTATGTIERSGDWKILIDRINEALHRIDAAWMLQHQNVTFLV